MKKLFLLTIIIACLAGNTALAQRADYNIIPLPKQVETDTTQYFTLQTGMGIAYDATSEEITRNAKFFSEWVEQSTGIKLALTPNDKKAAVRMSLGFASDKKLREGETLTEQQQEAYKINIDDKGILIEARNPIGLFRAAQTLRKAMPIVKDTKDAKIEMPYTKIQDEPRFVYRGTLLDCGRHFFTVEVIKQMLDVMALHGCNQFHWHLTEDQGWRFEVKSLPNLALHGSVRQETVVGPNVGIYDGIPYGGYYTQ